MGEREHVHGYGCYMSVCREEYEALKAELEQAREREKRLRDCIELRAAKQAYDADLGASEWEAFLTTTEYELLAAQPEQEQALARCGNTIHSEYVTDHRCRRERGHSGDCLFGQPEQEQAGQEFQDDEQHRWLKFESEEKRA